MSPISSRPARSNAVADRHSASPGNRLRATVLLFHRYVGLSTAVFLAMAGMTGTFLVFLHELDAWLNPDLLVAEAPVSGPTPLDPLDPLELRERVERQLPAARVEYVDLKQEPGKAASFWVSAREGKIFVDDEVLVNPYTGAILGSRHWGDIRQGRKTLMSFLYRLHYALALDKVGTVLMGIVALLWTFDCFAGAWLTLPSRRAPGTPAMEGGAGTGRKKSWLARWKPAWLVRAGGSFAFVFSWHRASGLWVWAMLLVFAWSSVGLNLEEVYNPVMKTVLGMEKRAWETLKELDKPLVDPRITWPEAREIGRKRMMEAARLRGIRIFEERGMGYDPSRGVYRYQVRSSRDISDRYPSTTVWFDADTGALRAFEAATGETAGNTLTAWIYHLHWGSIAMGGLPYRIFVSLMGLAVAGLSVTGVWVWWKKFRIRARLRNRPRAGKGEAETGLFFPASKKGIG
jgi:uncharacterized iron-regulated membrane protein